MAYQILIVDDDADFREELCMCLEDYQVIEAANGQEALMLLKKPNAIDLVILDAVMPLMPGTEVLKEIKRFKPSMNIIMLTGKSSKDIAIEALKGKADDYIEKPINIERFLDVVRSTLSMKIKKEVPQTHGIHSKIEEAKKFIERNYDKKITLDDVAAQVSLSPKYFSRIFKEITGEGFNAYKLDHKVREACELLKKSEYTVSEISNRLGYQNLESFIRTFQKIMKQNPSQFRRKNRKKIS